MAETSGTRESSALVACGVVLAVSAAVRLSLALGTDLYFDEAYYWQWSRHLAWGYYDHSPLVAWMIAALGVRPVALLCGAGTVAAVWGLARDVYGRSEEAWRAAALFSVVPVGAVSGVWATPDSPLLLFWALALWALWRERWVLAGVASGLALLSKYPGVLLALAFVVAVVRARRLPAGAWVTALVGAGFFLPVVVWNAEREWVGFAFQLRHGLGGVGGWETLGAFLVGQLLLGGPVLFPLAVVYGFGGRREHMLLRAAVLVPLVVFGYSAWRTRGEANWPAAAYVAASIGVAGMGRWMWRAAVGSGLVLVLAVASHVLWPVLSFGQDTALARTHGWAELAVLSQPERLFPGARAEQVKVVWAPSYQLASEAAYYSGLEADTAGWARRSQYDLWPEPRVEPGEDALWLAPNAEDPPPADLVERFTAVEGPARIPADFHGRRLHTFHVWWLRSAK